MVDPRQHAAGSGKRQAVVSGLVAAALTLSLTPSLAFADTDEKVGTASTATNIEAAPTQTEDVTPSTQQYSVAAQSDDVTSSNDYDLSTIDLSKIADGDYYGTVHVAPTDDDPNEWEEYDITVKVSIASGKITAVAVTDESWDVVPSDSQQYLESAEFGKRKPVVIGVPDKIIEANNTNVDIVSSSTRSSIALKEATYNALTKAYADQNPTTPAEDEYTYGYVGLSWGEYWAAEGVYAAGDTTSSDELDSHGEYDKGAFDTVSRATKNHGLHRGNYQCEVVIHTESGKDVEMAYWIDKTSFMTTGGETVGFSGGTLTFADGTTDAMVDYDNVGIKYVPVKVKTADLEALKASYSFVANGEELRGGYGENSLQSYVATADVDAETYGLKTATNDGGSFSFSARSAEGTDSGLKDQALKTASSGITVEQKAGTDIGTYGEFIRVDLKGDYGDLGANMQAVTWTYYGDDASRTAAKATFGTKFAADNWMHKSNGIQLGLTDSLRCQLPEGTDGTGYWTVTVHALGYQDYSFDIEAAADNIAKDETPVTDETKAALQALYDKAAALNEADYTAETWSNLVTERDETGELLAKDNLLESEASEQITHLQGAIDGLALAEGRYVLMNIPYAKFYANDVNNAVAVDGFTSATKNKSRTGSMVSGSYHVDPAGSDITGITFPVKVAEGVDVAALAEKLGGTLVTDDSSVDVTVTNKGNTSTTTYAGADALFEAASYSYYASSQAPSFYKELTVDANGDPQFSEIKGADGNAASATTLEGVSSTLKTDTTYGDYELDFDTDENATAKLADTIPGGSKLYAAIVNTDDGASYGLRHMENIWFPKGQMELAWATGFTTQVHNCPTSSAHYQAMMGHTITSVTFVTEGGIYQVPVADGYVPVKFDASAAAVESAQVGAASTKVTLPTLPDSFDPVYAIEGWTGDVEIKDGALILPSGQANGGYTLTVSDANDKFASFSADFELKADATAEYDADKVALVAKDGGDVTGYVAAIASVTVDGTEYKASGKGAKVVVNKDGSLNVGADPLSSLPYGAYEFVVHATGYNDLSFTYAKQADKAALNEAIAAAGQLAEADHTKASWAPFAEALTSAKDVAADAASSDEAVQKAAEALTQAQAALARLATADDKAALQAAIDKTFVEADYTKASWSAYQTALAAATEALAADELTQQQAQDATTALTEAQNALAAKATDEAKENLQNEVNKAEAFDKSDYTAESWEKYQAALDAASALLADEDASDADLKQALEDLKAARDGLVAASDEPQGTTPAGDSTDDGDSNDSGDETPKTGDYTLGIAGGVAALGAAAAALARFARRRING